MGLLSKSKKQGINEMNTLDLMTDKIVESIELLEYQNMYEEVLEEAIEFLLAQEDLTIESVREGIEHENIRVDEIAPLLMLGARLAAPYVMRAIGSRVAGNVAGRAAGWVGNKIMQKGGQRVATKLFGKHANKVTNTGGRVAKGEIKDLAGNLVPAVTGSKFNLGNGEEKKKRKTGGIEQPPKSDVLGSTQKYDPLDENIQYLEEGFGDWLNKTKNWARSKMRKTAQTIKDPKAWLRGAGKTALWAGKGLAKGALNATTDMVKDIPFIGGLAQMVKGGVDKTSKNMAKTSADRKQRYEDAKSERKDPKRKAALIKAEKDRQEAEKNKKPPDDPFYGGGSKVNNSTELFGQKIVESILNRVNEMKINKDIDRKEVRRMKAAGVSRSARREFTADDVARKESDRKIKASMGPNNPKNTFKPKPNLNKKYIQGGKKGKPETPMTKAQIDRSGTEGKPAAGRPGQTKAGVLKAKLDKIDRTSAAFMANLAKNPKNSQK